MSFVKRFFKSYFLCLFVLTGLFFSLQSCDTMLDDGAAYLVVTAQTRGSAGSYPPLYKILARLL